MILTAAQRRTMERAVAVANEVLPRIEALKALAEVDPSLSQRHEDLRTQRDFLHRLATTALTLDRESSNGR